MINGQKHWLWRAVDQDGFVLDALVQSRPLSKWSGSPARTLLRPFAFPRASAFPSSTAADDGPECERAMGDQAFARAVAPTINHRAT
jgi:hypothetical protein